MRKFILLIHFFLFLTGSVSAQKNNNTVSTSIQKIETDIKKTLEEMLGSQTNNEPVNETEDDAEIVSPEGNTLLRMDWLTTERVTATKDFNVKIGITTSEQPQDFKIKVRKDEINIPITRGTKVTKKDGYSIVLNETVKLKNSYNEIYVLIKINDKWYRSESIYVTYDPNGVFEKRIALVIGNSDYKNDWDILPNAKNDATAIADKLKELGFKVESTGINLTKDAFEKKLYDFKRESAGYDVALFYYAGHGTQDSEGKGNYLIPVDVKTANDNDLRSRCINAEQMVEEFIGGNNKIIILDACRSNMEYSPQATRGAKSAIRGRGFKQMKCSGETLILYSTGMGDSAYDGEKGKHSYFAEALLDSFDESNLTLENIINRVTQEVKDKTRKLGYGIQEPFRYGSYSSLGYLVLNKSY